jgi:hypothetical protein
LNSFSLIRWSCHCWHWLRTQKNQREIIHKHTDISEHFT